MQHTAVHAHAPILYNIADLVGSFQTMLPLNVGKGFMPMAISNSLAPGQVLVPVVVPLKKTSMS